MNQSTIKQNYAKTEDQMKVLLSKKYEKTIDDKGNKILNNTFQMLEKIGKGSFWSVRKVKRNLVENGKLLDNSLYALKKGVLNKKDYLLDSNESRIGIKEYLLLKELCHPNIVRLFECMIDEKRNVIAFIMQYCQYGELMNIVSNIHRENEEVNIDEHFEYNKPLMDFLFKKYNMTNNSSNILIPEVYSYNTSKDFFEFIAKQIFIQIASALNYLHNKKQIAHLDIKPTNILIYNDTDEINENDLCYVKLTDFSSSKKLNSLDDKIMQYRGTVLFLPPERDEESDEYYEDYVDPFKCDIYSLGATIFLFMFNSTDFKNYKNFMGNIKDVQLKEALEASLEKDYKIRANCIEIINILNKK